MRLYGVAGLSHSLFQSFPTFFARLQREIEVLAEEDEYQEDTDRYGNVGYVENSIEEQCLAGFIVDNWESYILYISSLITSFTFSKSDFETIASER